MFDNSKTPRTCENAEGVYSVKKPIRIINIIGSSSFFLLGIAFFLMVMMVYIIDGPQPLVLSMMYCPVIILLFVSGWGMICQEFLKFDFLDEGLLVKYPAKKKELISWNEFMEVCICYDGMNNKRTNALTCIAFVKKGEKKNFIYRWRTSNPFRYKKVISIYYSDEILARLKEKCPYEVVDLRKTTAYILTKSLSK